MRIYMLFGLNPGSIETARHQLEKLLGIRATGRDSLNKGEYYTYDTARERVKLMRNLDPEDGDVIRSEASQFSHIVFLDNAAETSPWIEKLINAPGLTFIWRKQHE